MSHQTIYIMTDIKLQQNSNGKDSYSEQKNVQLANKPTQKISKLKRLALEKYIRVGDEYFEKIQKPDKHGNLYYELDKRQKTTIIDDYGPKPHRYIKKYKSFCLIASHTDYKEVIGDCYNNYYPLTHTPAPGQIQHTMSMLTHIFGDKLEVALDYVQLLYTKPTQLLPIVCLVSSDRNTGKSTFGQWLIDIFGRNAVKLGNADIANEFNSTYAEKLVIVIDEATIEKRVVSEAVKRMSTETGKIFVNPKGRQQYEVEFIGKFIFISNDESKFITIGKGETRYFVVKVPVLQTDITDMKEKLNKEIPAFLHFIQNRKLHYPLKSRMYFDFEVYKTEQLQKVIEASTAKVETPIRELIIDTFDMVPDAIELSFSPRDIFEELSDKIKWIDETMIRNSLRDDFKLEPEKQQRYSYYSFKDSRISEVGIISYKRNGKPYLFKVQDFFGHDESKKRISKQ